MGALALSVPHGLVALPVGMANQGERWLLGDLPDDSRHAECAYLGRWREDSGRHLSVGLHPFRVPVGVGHRCRKLRQRKEVATHLQVFNDRRIRTVWDDKEEKWYFSVVDVIEALTDSPDPSTYWRVLKNRLKKEGNETVTNCNAFKLPARDGKMRLTPIADQEQLFRLIQLTCANADKLNDLIEKIARALNVASCAKTNRDVILTLG